MTKLIAPGNPSYTILVYILETIRPNVKEIRFLNHRGQNFPNYFPIFQRYYLEKIVKTFMFRS